MALRAPGTHNNANMPDRPHDGGAFRTSLRRTPGGGSRRRLPERYRKVGHPAHYCRFGRSRLIRSSLTTISAVPMPMVQPRVPWPVSARGFASSRFFRHRAGWKEWQDEGPSRDRAAHDPVGVPVNSSPKKPPKQLGPFFNQGLHAMVGKGHVPAGQLSGARDAQMGLQVADTSRFDRRSGKLSCEPFVGFIEWYADAVALGRVDVEKDAQLLSHEG